MSQAMVIETLTKEGLGTWLEKGINNVAFLSLGLGLENIASRAFIEAKVSRGRSCPISALTLSTTAEVLCASCERDRERGGGGREG